MYPARRILRDLADSDRRKRILLAFWKHADAQSKVMAQMQLAKALHFRDETIRKMAPEKKAELLASRIGVPEFEQLFDVALMAYHTREANTMLAAFLDQWQIPHDHGSIEEDDYKAPSADQVREAVKALEGQYDKRDIAVYLASAGLLMGDEWREATWPVVDELGINP